MVSDEEDGDSDKFPMPPIRKRQPHQRPEAVDYEHLVAIGCVPLLHLLLSPPSNKEGNFAETHICLRSQVRWGPVPG